ncbi:MAG: protein kinase domain-containing protein [Acidobacteriota bacterium]
MGVRDEGSIGGTAAPVVPRDTLGASLAFGDTGAPDAGAPGDAPWLVPGGRIRQYELIRELGRGGMGLVYAARDTRLGRRVAMKFLNHRSREVAGRFLVEARATAQCSHDNIVIIHEVDEHEGVPYMVLEYLEGHPLRELIDGGRMPVSRVVEIAVPISRALARAHELGIVHRDLKPENVFVTSAAQVKVLDFGIAKALGPASTVREAPAPAQVAAGTGELRLTREGSLLGTLPYMAPEQLGAEELDQRADVWALGIMMFEMLAGRHPIDPLTIHELLACAGSNDPMPAIASLRGDVPDELATLVDGCLRKRREERIASAGELAAELERMLPHRRGRALAEGESPYPGLTAFQEADADRFFGRDRDVARMVARVRELPLTGVIGPSGIGKSSFVRAGVGPALKASGEPWDIVTLRPGRQPLAALASVLERLTSRSGGSRETKLAEHDELVRRLRAEPGYLGAQLRVRAKQTAGQLLLFVDQFEELYTLAPSAEDRRAFTAALAGVADDSGSPLRVLVSMRSDFLERVAEHPAFAEELTRGLVLLAAPDRDGLREALVRPIELVGYRFETSAMVGDMLDALAASPGALPLLQFSAAKLWDARDRERRLLTVSSYHAIGGISGALAMHADDVIARLNAGARRLAHKIFRHLVTPERTRAIVELSDLQALASDRGEIARVIDQLVAARLLVVQSGGDSGGGSVELVHESLIERWPALRRWLDEDAEDAAYVAHLAAAAKQWDVKGRPAGLLWRGDAVDEARRWYAERPRDLTARDQAFIDAVFALARRGRRARRGALVGAFALLAVIAAGATIAFVWVRGAEQKATAAAAEANDRFEQLQRTEHERRTAEQRRSAAEQGKQKAEAEVKAKDALVQESREELQAENARLVDALGEASAARQRAERATASAEAAANEVRRAKAELEQNLERERQHVRQLEDEKRKLTTELK